MAEEYDNTNSGAFFTPFPEQKFILQGKVDVFGHEHKTILTTAENKDGSKRIDVWVKVGAVFPNDKGDNDKKPDYTGSVQYAGLMDEQGSFGKIRIAAWKKQTEDGKNFMSAQVSMPQTQVDNQPPTDNNPSKDVVIDDDIPFQDQLGV